MAGTGNKTIAIPASVWLVAGPGRKPPGKTTAERSRTKDSPMIPRATIHLDERLYGFAHKPSEASDPCCRARRQRELTSPGAGAVVTPIFRPVGAYQLCIRCERPDYRGVVSS